MPKSNAEYQAAHRARSKERIAGLHAYAERLEAENESLRAERDRLRRQNARLLEDLETAGADAGTAVPPCPHPAEAISNGQCTACGEWL